MSTRAQAPVTDFSASVTSGCGPLGVKFTDLSTNTPTNWNWDFGNGQTSTAQNPSVSYGAPGTYTVTLISRNASGANATRKTDYITVYPSPTVAFNSNITLACIPANVAFTDVSTAGQGVITSWAWDLGDGSTSNQQNPAHAYGQTGYYNVSLTVTNSGGCSNTITKVRFLRVVDGIQPNFVWNQVSTGCTAPFTINFTNQTAGPGNLTYSWNLNGATPASSSDTSPANISYPANGNYTATLQVQSSLGCSGSIQQVLPFSNNNAMLTGPDAVCVNTPAIFTNGSSPAPPVNNWDFGDGTTSTDPSVTKTYTATGSYTVKLVNKYPSCSDSTTKVVQVGNPPVPDFSSDVTSACKGPLAVQFTDLTPAGSASQWLWDFGDGNTSSLQNPSHTYNIAGVYDVKLTITSTSGCSNTVTKTAYIRIQAPTVTLANTATLGACVAGTTGNGSVNTINPVPVVNSVDAVASYAWSAPGATPSSSTLARPSFSYPTAGAYTISVTVTTAGGCSVSNTFSGVAKIGTPTAAVITANPNPVCGNLPVSFDDPVTPANEYQWRWQFGDGGDTLLDQSAISHSYNTPGNKTVMLTLIHNGCPQTTTQIVKVNPPIAGFSYTVDCANRFLVAFSDTSKVDVTLTPFTYTWDYDDGAPPVTTTGSSAPAHTFPNTGTTPHTYNVRLTIIDGGCTNSFALPITLSNLDISFTPPSPTVTSVCRNVNVLFKASSSTPQMITAYSWQISGLPQTPFSNSDNYTGRFIQNGNIPVTLTVKDINGCQVATTHPVTVTGPMARFALPSPAGGCVNSVITFTDQSTPDPVSNPIVSYSWIYGDNTTGSSNTHQYADTGSYLPQLTVTDAAGCPDSYPTFVAANGFVHITAPQPGFIGPDSFYCPQKPLTFTDTSKGYGPFTYQWNFGDGTSPTGPGTTDQNPSHSFPTSGQTYTVSLTTTDIYGCPGTTSNQVSIQSPIAAFDIADTTAICAPLQTDFTARGQFYDSLYWEFGDGASSTLPVTSHFYNTLGTFTAKLFLQGPGGCLDSAARNVILSNPITDTRFDYAPTQMCDSVPAQFTITPPGYTRFTLAFGDGVQDSSQNTTPFHMYRTPATYNPSMTLTDATGCIVTVYGPQAVVVQGTIPFFSGTPPTFCDQGLVTFTDYTITPNVGILSQTVDFGDNTGSYTLPAKGVTWTHDYTQPGTWAATMKVVTSGNCSETYSDTIRVYQTPHPVITINSQLCTGLVQFQGGLTAPQVDSIDWAWDFGNGQQSTDQNPTANFQPGNYTVKLRTSVSFGCNDQTSDDLTINPLPEIKGPHEITTPLGFPVTIPFTYSSNVATYTWTPVDRLDCPTCPNPVATLIFATTYKVTVTDVNNCSASDTVLIKTICNDKNYFLPNTFSPNGDGNNDYFYPRGSNLYNIQSLSVFNRWGQMVFQRKNFPANSATMGWDGNFNGRPAPSDAYVYIVEVVCDNAQIIALHGDVTLVR